MSWDVVLFYLPEGAHSLADLSRDFTPPPLGDKAAILTAVTRAVPQADLSDPDWGLLDGPGWSIELNIGSRDPVDSVMLHLRGGGDDVLIPVFLLARELGCQVLDCSNGEVLSSAEETAGWHSFQQFRDHVVNGNG
jgi:hypothetical protein